MPHTSLWHVAQATLRSEDRIGSKKSRRPSSIFSGVLRLSAGSASSGKRLYVQGMGGPS